MSEEENQEVLDAAYALGVDGLDTECEELIDAGFGGWLHEILCQ